MRRLTILLIALCFLFLAKPPVQAADSAPDSAAAAADKEAAELRAAAYKPMPRDCRTVVKLIERAVAILETAHGPDHPLVADYLAELSSCYRETLDPLKELTLYERVVAIREKLPLSTLKQDETLINSLQMLAGLYAQRRKYSAAELFYGRAFALSAKVFGAGSRDYATLLVQQSASFLGTDYPRQQQLLERALAIYEQQADVEDRDLMGLLSNIAYTYEMRGLYAGEEKYLRRILAIFERIPQSPRDEAQSLRGWSTHIISLSRAIQHQGHDSEANVLYQRAEGKLLGAIEREEERLRADPQRKLEDMQSLLSALIAIYSNWGLLDKTIRALERKLELDRKTFGPDSPLVASSEQSLGYMFLKRGNLKRARELFAHSIQIDQKTSAAAGGLSHSLFQLADIAHAEGHFAESLKLLEQVRQGYARVHGSAATYNFLLRQSRLYLAMGQVSRALALLSTGLADSEAALKLVQTSGSEQDKLGELASFLTHIDSAVGLHVRFAPKDPHALALAFTTMLRRKGLGIDAFSAGMSALRRRLAPADQDKLEQLTAARSAIGRLVLHPPAAPTPQYQTQVVELGERIRLLESELFQVSPELSVTNTPVTLDQVRAALPADSALVEFITFQPDNVRQPLPRDPPKPDPAARQYVAYVQRASGPPQYIVLGSAVTIDAQVQKLREALASPTRSDALALGRALEASVMQPVRALVGDARHLFLSLDDALNLVPFAALVGEDGKFLLQRYTFTHLSSGRDLVRLRAQQLQSRNKSLIIAAPAFGEPRSATEIAAEQTTRGRRSQDLQLVSTWNPLPATAQEAQTVSELLGDAVVLTGAAATEEALKRMAPPRVLHLATHGFFLPAPSSDRVSENPLLRSGLILAGANRLQSGSEDGVLTALELSGLDLGGTQLVVLSACETGLGQIQSGEGVYGLRRALVVAGAETQVMSLWQVDDNATRDLMVGFYRRLQQGKGRADALRQAQLKILDSEETKHPYYWASFILAGDWQPMREAGAQQAAPGTP